MNILVSGGAGFIGSHTVVELINEGHHPVIVDDFSNSEEDVIDRLNEITGKKITSYKGSCNDLAFLNSVFEKESIDGVIHFAASKAVGESVENPVKYYQNNVGSLLVMIEAMRVAKCKKLVFSSSCTVYGEPDVVPVTETTPRKPANSPYGNTKTICEDILRDIQVSGEDFQFIALRYFNPVGAHESALIGELPKGIPSNLIPYITQTAIGIREKLVVFGDDYDTEDGTNIRDFIHVVDLAKAHVAAFEFLKSKSTGFYDVFNIGTGEGYSVLQLIQTFEKVNNLKLNYNIGPRRAGDTVKIYGDVTKAKEVLGWQTQLSLEDAMRDAWKWEKALKSKNTQS
ncbi:UDP-galactose 4-epimerase [Spirosomataceae bacterium TFI 002]|nr:UDP-galactose 4-epimerase [Spirosomataceae bacterium TFI 002]